MGNDKRSTPACALDNVKQDLGTERPPARRRWDLKEEPIACGRRISVYLRASQCVAVARP